MVRSGSDGSLFTRIPHWQMSWVARIVAGLVGLVELLRAVIALGGGARTTIGSGTSLTLKY